MAWLDAARRAFRPWRPTRPSGLGAAVFLAGMALFTPAWGQGQPGGHDRDGQWMHGTMRCIDRTVDQLAARGGDPEAVAETAFGACRHLVALAGVDRNRRETLEQAVWNYALQSALRRLEGR